MTTIITRLYADEPTANGVASSLLEASFRGKDISVVSSAATAHADMAALRVPSDAMAAYAEKIGQGNALVVLQAPFGTALAATSIVDATPSIDVEVAQTDAYVETDMDDHYRGSILTDHPRFMSSGMYPSLSRGRSTLATLFGKPLLRKKLNLDRSLYRGTKYWANFPLPHLSRKPRKSLRHYIYPGTKYWANFPLPHLTSRDRDPSLY